MSRRQPSVIAVDGPTASGKTVVGRVLARRLGYRFVDTGAMYRAVTWLALRDSVGVADEDELARLAAQHVLAPTTDPDADGIVVDGVYLGAELVAREVEHTVSEVSRVAGVRDAMVAQQRRLAGEGGVVMAGRDIGTVVLSDADVKLFLVASSRMRARRRLADLQAAGVAVTYEDVLSNLVRRDRLDSARAVSPLRPADDANIIETDYLDVAAVLAVAADLIRSFSGKAAEG